MKWTLLGALGLKVMTLGLLAFGGLTVVLVQLEKDFVGTGLLTSDEFAQSYALASAAPGPNAPIFLSLLGWQAFGLPGVIVLVIAWAVPTLFITHQLGRMSQAHENPTIERLLTVLKAGAVGLILAGALALTSSFDASVPLFAVVQSLLAFGSSVVLVRTQINPLIVLATCMVVGAIVI